MKKINKIGKLYQNYLRKGCGTSTHMVVHNLTLTPVLGDPVPSSEFRMYMVHLLACRQNVHIHKIKLNKSLFLKRQKFLLKQSKMNYNQYYSIKASRYEVLCQERRKSNRFPSHIPRFMANIHIIRDK